MKYETPYVVAETAEDDVAIIGSERPATATKKRNRRGRRYGELFMRLVLLV
jgi:hypothetical protein